VLRVQGLGIDMVMWSLWTHRPGQGLQIEIPLDGPRVPPRNNGTCFWKPPGHTCQRFYRATHDGDGRARPLAAHAAGGAVERDEHDMGTAAIWRRCDCISIAGRV
jgi:hypothetical protein